MVNRPAGLVGAVGVGPGEHGNAANEGLVETAPGELPQNGEERRRDDNDTEALGAQGTHDEDVRDEAERGSAHVAAEDEDRLADGADRRTARGGALRTFRGVHHGPARRTGLLLRVGDRHSAG